MTFEGVEKNGRVEQMNESESPSGSARSGGARTERDRVEGRTRD